MSAVTIQVVPAAEIQMRDVLLVGDQPRQVEWIGHRRVITVRHIEFGGFNDGHKWSMLVPLRTSVAKVIEENNAS